VLPAEVVGEDEHDVGPRGVRGGERGAGEQADHAGGKADSGHRWASRVIWTLVAQASCLCSFPHRQDACATKKNHYRDSAIRYFRTNSSLSVTPSPGRSGTSIQPPTDC